MTKFVKSIHGHVSLSASGKYLPEGQVFPFTDEEASLDEVKDFERIGYIIIADTRKKAEAHKFVPIHLQPLHSKPLHELSKQKELIGIEKVDIERKEDLEDTHDVKEPEHNDIEDPPGDEMKPPIKKIRIMVPPKKD